MKIGYFNPRLAPISSYPSSHKALAAIIGTLAMGIFAANIIAFAFTPLRNYTPLYLVPATLTYLTLLHGGVLLGALAITTLFATNYFFYINFHSKPPLPPPPVPQIRVFNERGNLVLQLKEPKLKREPVLFYRPAPYNPRYNAEIALCFNFPDLLKEALSQDASWINEIDAFVQTVLDREKNEEMRAILMAHGAKSVEELLPPLELILQRGDHQLLEKHLKQGMDPNALDNSCRTPLDRCSNRPELANVLVKYGAKKFIELTPLLHYFIRRQEASDLKLCLSFPQAAEIIYKKPIGTFEELDKFGKTPLDYVVKGSAIEVLLIQNWYIQPKETDSSHGSSDEEQIEIPES